MIEIVKATAQHCADLTPRIKPIDSVEMNAVNMDGKSNEELLLLYERYSQKSFAVVDDKLGCIALYGVAKIAPTTGVPWMITSQEFLNDHSTRFLRECKAHMLDLIKDYKQVFNYVHIDNVVCHRWLTWLGFTVHKHKVLTIHETPFYLFDRKV